MIEPKTYTVNLSKYHGPDKKVINLTSDGLEEFVSYFGQLLTTYIHEESEDFSERTQPNLTFQKFK